MNLHLNVLPFSAAGSLDSKLVSPPRFGEKRVMKSNVPIQPNSSSEMTSAVYLANGRAGVRKELGLLVSIQESRTS